MERFQTLAQVEKYQVESGICGAVIRAFRCDEEIAESEHNDPDEQGCFWLLRPSDTDVSVAAVFGKPLMEISFDCVKYHPEDEHFLCRLILNDSHCNTLVVPDAYWLKEDWREWLLTQL